MVDELELPGTAVQAPSAAHEAVASAANKERWMGMIRNVVFQPPREGCRSSSPHCR
jgi:hypothetical protein